MSSTLSESLGLQLKTPCEAFQRPRNASALVPKLMFGNGPSSKLCFAREDNGCAIENNLGRLTSKRNRVSRKNVPKPEPEFGNEERSRFSSSGTLLALPPQLPGMNSNRWFDGFIMSVRC